MIANIWHYSGDLEVGVQQQFCLELSKKSIII